MNQRYGWLLLWALLFSAPSWSCNYLCQKGIKWLVSTSIVADVATSGLSYGAKEESTDASQTRSYTVQATLYGSAAGSMLLAYWCARAGEINRGLAGVSFLISFAGLGTSYWDHIQNSNQTVLSHAALSAGTVATLSHFMTMLLMLIRGEPQNALDAGLMV